MRTSKGAVYFVGTVILTVCMALTLLSKPLSIGYADDSIIAPSRQVDLNLTEPSIDSSCLIDCTNASDGYVGVSPSHDKEVKLQIRNGNDEKIFPVPNQGSTAVPLVLGSGTYELILYYQQSGNSYLQEALVSREVLLSDETAPYSLPTGMCLYDPFSDYSTIALDISSSSLTDAEAFSRITEWVGLNISYDGLKAKLGLTWYIPSVGTTYTTEQGICYDKASLVAAMCRSVNIPCQVVTGDVYIDDKSLLSTEGSLYHAWNKAWVGNMWIEDDCDIPITTPRVSSVAF